jgi:flagellar L-ring protein FlgH
MHDMEKSSETGKMEDGGWATVSILSPSILPCRSAIPHRRTTVMHPRISSLVWILFALLLGPVLEGRAQHASMFADPKARKAGDILTVVLAERTAAQRESNWQNRSSSSMAGDAGIAGDAGLAGRFSADASFNKEALNRNQSVQSDLLRGTVSVRVTATDEIGNLVILGERRLSVNGETHVMKVAGIVRPFDIRYDNSILSYQIANASIEYHRAGFGRKFVRPGFLARAGAVAMLGAAIFFATQ